VSEYPTPAINAVEAARAAILKAAEAPEYAYVPYSLWLDYEAAVSDRNTENLRDLAKMMRPKEGEAA
jgi:hypothetical protein